jgi:hypothetical protein
MKYADNVSNSFYGFFLLLPLLSPFVNDSFRCRLINTMQQAGGKISRAVLELQHSMTIPFDQLTRKQ